MTAHQGTVRAIAVDATTITIQGESQRHDLDRVGVYFFPPYAEIPAQLSGPPAALAAGGTNG